MKEETPKKQYDWEDLRTQVAAGGGAGAISRTLMAPLERVKVLLQVQEVSLVPVKDRYKGVWDCLVRIPREQGFVAYWRGNGVNVARMIPNSAIKFTTFDAYKRWAFPDGESAYSSWELYVRKMACGGLSGISTILPVYPMDLARTRLTADIASKRQYTGLIDCLSRTAKNEGIFGLYKGLFISLAGIIPYLAISLALYDTLKDATKKSKSRFWSSPFGLVTLGSVAAVVSQTVAYPMDTVRRHMQVSGALGQESRYVGTRDCISKIYKSSGLGGFYRGVFANALRAAPQTGIEFACYDLIRKWLDG
jgi:solute carrier family 25 (adenine nucleotide translocator) protein 4/5/6/31